MGSEVIGGELAETIGDLDRSLAGHRRRGSSIGFIPTLGGLHRGHGALIEAARRANDIVVVSVFLNPTQFGDQADLACYPHDLAADRALAVSAGADIVFAPPLEEMYPAGAGLVTVDPGSLGDMLEGATRPGHFRGVATVVTKLLAIVAPTAAYFGEKDYQQLVIVRQLVADLSLGTRVVACPTVRDPDGLAVSSRNAFLGPSDRRVATVLFRALTAGAAVVAAGVADGTRVEATMRATVSAEPAVDLDYATVVADGSLEQLTVVAGDVVLLIAARLGDVRLINNLRVGR